MASQPEVTVIIPNYNGKKLWKMYTDLRDRLARILSFWWWTTDRTTAVQR